MIRYGLVKAARRKIRLFRRKEARFLKILQKNPWVKSKHAFRVSESPRSLREAALPKENASKISHGDSNFVEKAA